MITQWDHGAVRRAADARGHAGRGQHGESVGGRHCAPWQQPGTGGLHLKQPPLLPTVSLHGCTCLAYLEDVSATSDQ